MAETGKKAVEVSSTAPSSDADTVTEPTGNVTKENPRGAYLVRTVWPNASFDMPDDDVPMITLAGTRLTKAQLDTAEKSAAAHGVELTVEDVK